MTKIKTYPIDTNISGGDKWIGTDSNSNGITKNFTVSGLVDYLNNVSAINLSNSLKFKYDTVDVGDDRAIESFSFETEVGATVDFSSISSLMFHKNASNGKNIVNLMSAFSGNIVMLSKVDEPNKFAFYKITSYEQNITETDFYDTSLSYIQGNGSIEEDEFYFLSLLQFDNIVTSASDFVFFNVKNETGSTILKGKGVMAVGTDGNSGHILVDEMVADGTVESKYFLGVLEEDIPNGGFARVISFGQLSQFNTNGQNGETWADGQVLWCDPANPGDFTITEPDGPNVKIAAAFILNSSTNGKIQVRVQANEGVHDLHDTKITFQVDGDVLVWDDTTGVWFNDSTLNVDYTNGRVGIGTTIPSSELDVHGTISLNGFDGLRYDTKSQSLYAGHLAGNNQGRSNGFGYHALESNTGNYSNGFGFYALSDNQGINSNGFGYLALQNNEGDYSDGFGHLALRNNTGNYSNGFGYFALSDNAGANSNGFGHYALNNNQGDDSNGFGHYALSDNQGINSNGFGYYALRYNQGVNNTAIGHEAGFETTPLTGGNNTFLGGNASYGANNTITNSTAVGANVTLTDSNTVILGNGADVGIGTTSPTQKLDVDGNVKADDFIGNGSQLTNVDADTLDGLNSTDFAIKSNDNTFTGTNTFNTGNSDTAIIIDNTDASSKGIVIDTSGDFNNVGLEINNSFQGAGIIVNNTNLGFGIYAKDTVNGAAITGLSEGIGAALLGQTIGGGEALRLLGSSTGLLIKGINGATTTFTLNKEGDVVANSFTGDGSGLTNLPTKTSDLTNDGADGVNPFITSGDLPDTSGLVPYTGATSDVDLGANGIKADSFNNLTIIDWTESNPNNIGVGNLSGNSSPNTVGVGNQALRNGINNDNSVAFGSLAGLNYDGNDLTAVGHGAGQDSAGDDNTFVGNAAGAFSTIGDKKTAVGFQALRTSEGSDINFFGYQAGRAQKGDFNNGFGSNTLEYAATTSSNLTAIGHRAAVGTVGTPIDFVNSTAIGANSNITKSNQVTLGNANTEEVLTSGNVNANSFRSSIVTATGVTGTYNLDYFATDNWDLTLTGATTLTESNLPGTGETQTIFIFATGGSITLPATGTNYVVGTYDGAVENWIVIKYFNSKRVITITQPD